ncbi:MAG: HDOD domain-containing protein, partial [Betaproteobacteria bacterium]
MTVLADWVRNLSGKDIPVLRSTIDALRRLRKKEDTLTARDLSHMVLCDPLMTLKVLRFSQSRLTKRQPTEVTTVEHAVMMHGLTAFFAEMNSLQAIEDQMVDQPRALQGVLRVISRATHAGSYARSFSALRHDMESDEVVTSALLHDLGELLLWNVAPGIAVQIEHLTHHHRGLRSATAQRACLGFELVELQLALAKEWNLPALLQSLMDDHHADTPRVTTVALSVALARHSANGWDDEALPSDYAAIQKLVNLPAANAMRCIRQAALVAAHTWNFTGVRPAAAWLPLLPGDWPEEADPAASEEAADVMIRVTQQLAHLGAQLCDVATVSALVFYALHIALGARHIWFGAVDGAGAKVVTQQALMLESGLLPGELGFALGSPHLFARLIGKVQGVWFSDAHRAKLSPLLPPSLAKKLGNREFLAMSLHLKGQPYGMLYMDGGSQKPKLSESDYAAFKSLCLAMSQALERR